MRASDADREEIAERLRHAAAEGRLLAFELEERVARALRARTYGELDAIVADLPRGAVAVPPRSELARWVRPALALALAVPLVLSALAFVAAAAFFVLSGVFSTWVVWMMLAWFVFGSRHHHHRAHRRHGGYPGQGPHGFGGQRRAARFGYWS